MNVFIVNGHERWEGFAEGRLCRTLVDTAKEQLEGAGHQVRITTVETGYEVPAELESYQWADVVLFQMPVYWMSVPALFKKYIDQVFTMGIGEVLCKDDGRTRSDPTRKYGSGGLMNGKKYMLSTTWNAPLESFQDPAQFFEGRGVDGPFMWLHKAFQFFGMDPLPTFSCHDVLKNADVEGDLARFKDHLGKIF